MASALPAEILCHIIGKLSLKDKFKTLSISTKWNNASSVLLEQQTSFCVTYWIEAKAYQICDERTHRIDSKGWLPVSLITNKTALNTVLKKMPKLKVVGGNYLNCDMSHVFIQSVMKNWIQIECLAGFSGIINLSSLKHFFGKVDKDSLSHLIKTNKDLELLMVEDKRRYMKGNFIWNLIHLEKLHTLHMRFITSFVSEKYFLGFLRKWEELNRRHLNIVLEQYTSIETDNVRATLATISNVDVKFVKPKPAKLKNSRTVRCSGFW